MSPRRRSDSSQSSLSGSGSLSPGKGLEDAMIQLENFKDMRKKEEKEKFKWSKTGYERQIVF